MNIHEIAVSGWGIHHPLPMNLVQIQFNCIHDFGDNLMNMLMDIHEIAVTVMNIRRLWSVGGVCTNHYL